MNRRSRLLLSISSVLAVYTLAPLVNGQSKPVPFRPTTIHGVVRDSVTHTGIEHVIVMLEREDSGYVGQTETDGMGKFTFQGPGQIVFVLRAKIPGHKEGTQRVDLTVGT